MITNSITSVIHSVNTNVIIKELKHMNKIKTCNECQYFKISCEKDNKMPIVRYFCKHRDTYIKKTDVLNQIDINCNLQR